MTGKDIFDHLAALEHSVPTSPEQVDPPEAFDDAVDQIREDREHYAENLRNQWHASDEDPLLMEIANVRRERDAADRRLRQLVAYGAEFVGPRPYPLMRLAQAAGLASHSAARNFYSPKDIDYVAKATGAKRTRKDT